MKKISFLFFLIFFDVFPQTDQMLYLKDVDHAPVLKECRSAVKHDKQCFLNTLNGYVAQRVVLPFDEMNNPIEGKVKVYLVFDKSGKLIVKAVRTQNKTLKESADTVFKGFASFKPAVKDGQNVSMMMVYPINYRFSGNKEGVFSINQVSPPQMKIHKKKRPAEELRKQYHEYVFSKFVENNRIKGHLVSSDARLIKFGFEIDSTGKVDHFKDLVKPGSDDEKYLNKKAVRMKHFLIPPKIGNVPVTIRDTINFVKKGHFVRPETREREVITDY